ncbi:Na-translocating system protein MpsC family protein [Planococcus sp. N028]|uniref:Na-translocating system protein MpsC family protein n=1 Tax=Planococcus shixiaomingii TaxID=3058393 RepID=A0ABT8N3S4_9BACL|nr:MULTISPECIES: Na-translocating system protein MpsC family protein [unclassified Planococcus (in: firmicutes)]MDN7242393.1 Na-translocating system protein MpsC family protein [Planococcus sp. N028]WKA54634.1 Na-translocating system protein MpsC family protein [Planococcus sp. N022]
MSKDKTLQAEIGGYISTMLRRHFGKGPTSVYVTINQPFITIHFQGFLSPMEANLIKQNEIKRVLETRDILMNDLRVEIIQGLKQIDRLEVKELYADWNLAKETGLIICVLEDESDEISLPWPDDVDKEAFRKKIEQASDKAEKVPARTETYWLSDRTILVRRTEILIRIEKALIRNGFTEELKIAKRPLEHEVLKEVQLETVLKRKISETFLDWNFDTDLGYVVFLLEPNKQDMEV